MTYRIVHRTDYRYPEEVSASFGRIHLMPRDVPGQVCRSSAIDIAPDPDEVSEHTDHFGNRSTYFALHRTHTRLTVTSTSLVDVSGRAARVADAVARATMPWEETARRCRVEDAEEALEAREYLLDSALVPRSAELTGYARPSFPPGRPVGEAVADLVGRVHRDFTYRAGATSVRTTLAEVLERRAGVCQDFAHVTIGCLRSVGLPARYVSGYLETDPPPGRPRLEGADASHAWASVFVPRVGWIDVDPTNDVVIGDRHITTAWGRDYSDVPPLKGVIYTDATEHDLHVSVDVVPVGEADAERAVLPV